MFSLTSELQELQMSGQDPISGKQHYERPAGILPLVYTCSPRRRLRPLLTPTTRVPLPNPLPDPLMRRAAFTPTHTLTVHLAGAAFPREPSTPGHISAPPPSAFKSKEDRKQWLEDTARRMLYEKKESESAVPDPRARVTVGTVGLWSTLLRITRNELADAGDDKKRITIITTHAIGFHKETWEPMFRDLIKITESPASPIRIQEIWSLEAVNHGDAALLNADYLPKLPDRVDYGRDLANFLLHYLPDGLDAFARELPTILPPIPEATTTSRIKSGFTDRYVIPVGHSLGADAAGLAALSFPKLFRAVVLCEATFFSPATKPAKRQVQIISQTLGRRSSWTSRDEARAALLKAPMFRSLRQDVFNSYVQYALCDNPLTGMVELKSHPGLECGEFAAQRTMFEGWELIPTLDKDIELRWVMGDKPEASSIIGGPEEARAVIWKRPENTSNIKLQDCGHLCVQEKPGLLAEDIALFLSKKFVKGLGVVPSVIKLATETKSKL